MHYIDINKYNDSTYFSVCRDSHNGHYVPYVCCYNFNDLGCLFYSCLFGLFHV